MYYKKCICASKASIFLKNNRFIYWICHSHSRRKLAYESEKWMAYSEGEAVFFKKVRVCWSMSSIVRTYFRGGAHICGRCPRSYKIHSSIKYGLHLDAVISRWACEHANEVGVLDVTKNIPHMQILIDFLLKSSKNHAILWVAKLYFPFFWVVQFSRILQIITRNYCD